METMVAYSGQSLMCDIGGSLGLIIGATILTVCEIIDFIVQLAASCVKARAATHNSP